jgi:hypothetical protein
MDPAKPHSVWAPTGDSALVCVELLRVGDTTIVVKAEALPISNYMTGKGEMVVGKLEDLALGRIPLSAAWSSYFRSRFTAMKQLTDPVPLP